MTHSDSREIIKHKRKERQKDFAISLLITDLEF